MRTIVLLALLAALASMAAPAAAASGASVKTMPPSVVKTVPMAGDTQVAPSTKEIKITFSKDMMTKEMWSLCQVSKETFPKFDGAIHYLDDKRTCVIPVKLEAGKTYILWINCEQYDSFRDAENNPAVPYLLVFETADQ